MIFFPHFTFLAIDSSIFYMTLVLEALIYITLTPLWSHFIVCFIAEKQSGFTDRIYCSFFPNCFWHMFMFWLLHHCYS